MLIDWLDASRLSDGGMDWSAIPDLGGMLP